MSDEDLDNFRLSPAETIYLAEINRGNTLQWMTGTLEWVQETPGGTFEVERNTLFRLYNKKMISVHMNGDGPPVLEMMDFGKEWLARWLERERARLEALKKKQVQSDDGWAEEIG